MEIGVCDKCGKIGVVRRYYQTGYWHYTDPGTTDINEKTTAWTFHASE